jgi:hypothetical protein
MSPRLQLTIPGLLVVLVVGATVALAGFGMPGVGRTAIPSPSPAAPGSGGPAGSGAKLSDGGASLPAPSPTPQPPLGGTELYGYLPYWQMNASMARYLRRVPVSTLALFSVTSRSDGALDRRQTGYRRIVGDIGSRLIREAHAHGGRVELVFTSFGGDRNASLFGREPESSAGAGGSGQPGASIDPPRGSQLSPPAAPSLDTTPRLTPAPWERAARELIELAVDLGVDGINVDIERLDDADRPAYGRFLEALVDGVTEVIPAGTVSVATEASLRGARNAAEAIGANVDRVFLMGYDYHWSDSQPGASSPIDRSDGLMTLTWSIDQYLALGVPRDRITLGLPLYGMTWRTFGPDRTSLVLGAGEVWIPNRHLDLLTDPSFKPGRDLRESVEFFVTPDDDAWRITYYDSPATLRTKLALARDAGLAGAGFWALGYERGVPGYLSLMTDFRAGRIDRSDLAEFP